MNDRPTIIITGSSGLVGSNLVAYFSKLGFQVRAFQRSLPEHRNPSVSYYSFDLTNVQDKGFQGADYLIHCAYRPIISSKERAWGPNIDLEGTQKVISFSRTHGVKIIFLSTTSAHAESRSYYAKNKLLLEKLFDDSRDLILKLGLVLGGQGGLFGKIKLSLQRYKIVPLVGGGRQHIQTLALNDLPRIIEIGIKKNISGTFRIAHPAVVTMKELYRGIADAIGVQPFFVPIPFIITYWGARMIEKIGLQLPFTSENVLGLQDLRAFDVVHDLERFGVEVEDWQTALK